MPPAGQSKTYQYRSNHDQVIGNVRATSKYMAAMGDEVGALVAENTLVKALQYSSGTLSYAELRRWSPGRYSTQRGAMEDDYLVNAQTGRFRSMWQLTSGAGRAGGVKWSLRNPTRVGKWVLLSLFTTGTKRMRKRPLTQRLGTETKAEIKRALHTMRMRVLRQWRRQEAVRLKAVK